MHRFYVPSHNISSQKIIVSDKKQMHHLRDVLRFNINDDAVVFDEWGNEYTVEIEKLSPQSITLKIKHKSAPIAFKKSKITFACAIPKKSKMDDIINKLTQLGVDRIIPLKTARVVVKLDKHKELQRQQRWRRIALNASQQSQRNALPVIDAIKDISEVLSESAAFDLKLIPTLIGERKSLKEIFLESKPKNLLIIIGPEGDFTGKEIELAIRAGCIPITLGDLVLRAETAAIAVVSFIRLLFL